MPEANEAVSSDRAQDLPQASVQSPHPSRVLDWGSLFGKWTFTHTATDTNGEYLEARVVVTSPGEGPPLHIHHYAEESYQVLSGTLDVQLGKEWKRIGPGETLTVPRGTPHTLRTTVPVELINVHRPALAFEQMFRTMHRLVTEHQVGLPPKDFRSAVLVGMLFTAYERENATVEPPQLVMRGLSLLGRLLRFKLPA